MVQKVEGSRATIEALKEQVAQDREAMTHGIEEAEKMLHRTGGANVTAGLTWPNTPADEVIARQQVPLVAALRDRDEARAYLRERGDDLLQLRGELNYVQHALTEQVTKLTVEIKRMSALCESMWVLRENAEFLQQATASYGHRQDGRIQTLRNDLVAAWHDLRQKEVQSREVMLANVNLIKKFHEMRDVEVQPELQRLSAELKESESKRQVLVESAALYAGDIAS
ncbi:unnamed protein product [Aphanomyces euteiches]